MLPLSLKDIYIRLITQEEKYLNTTKYYEVLWNI